MLGSGLGLGAAVLAGGGAGGAFEGVAEGGFVGITHFNGDGFDAQTAITQQGAGFAHPAFGQIVQRGAADGGGETGGEGATADAGLGGQTGDGPRGFRARVHVAQHGGEFGIENSLKTRARRGAGAGGGIGADGLNEQDMHQMVDDALGAGQVGGQFAGEEL